MDWIIYFPCNYGYVGGSCDYNELAGMWWSYNKRIMGKKKDRQRMID